MITFPFDTRALIDICRQDDVVKIGVFGSMVRGEADEQSDIDGCLTDAGQLQLTFTLLRDSPLRLQCAKVLGLSRSLVKVLGS